MGIARDDCYFVVLVLAAAKTKTRADGRGEGKVTGRPSTLTVAFDGEPIVIRELPVIVNSSSRPRATAAPPLRNRIETVERCDDRERNQSSLCRWRRAASSSEFGGESLKA